MRHIAKVFQNGRSQAVRLPAAFRFDAKEVFVRRDPVTGDVILSTRPTDWEGLLAAADRVGAEGADFLVDRKDEAPQVRPIF
ncbi:MAG: antitoxin [Burkholderiaceae bacterium]|jgi:antitoxin VapB